MDKYDDLNLLLEDLFDTKDEILVYDIAPKVEEVMHRKSLDIYDMYDNSMSNRHDLGQVGSFGDLESIQTDIISTSKGMEIIVTNDATGSNLDSNSYLDEIISTGEGYQYSRETVGARDFENATMDEIEQSQLVENILERKLKSKGYDFK